MDNWNRCGETKMRRHRGLIASVQSVPLRTPLLAAAVFMLSFGMAVLSAPTAVGAEPPSLHLETAVPTSFSEIEVSGTAEVHGGEALFVVIQVLADEEGAPVESEFIQEVPEGTTGSVPIQGVIHRLHSGTHYFVRLFGETPAEERVQSPKPYLSVTSPAEPPLSPQVTGEEVASVGASNALLIAQINPERAETTYQFEYLPADAFDAGGWSSPALQTSGVLGTLPADSEEHAVSYQVQGLIPGIPYVWRATAENAVGPGVGKTTTVGTYGPTPTLAPCPNQGFRVGVAEGLPDCRAYEQASPTAKNAANVEGLAGFLLASDEAENPRASFINTTGAGIPAAGGGRQDLTPMISSREGESWLTQRLFPPESEATEAIFRGMSQNLRFVLDQVNPSPEGAPKTAGLDLIDTTTGSITPIVPPEVHISAPEVVFSDDAISNDGSYVFFESTAVVAFGARPARTNLYKWDRASNSVALVGVLPGQQEAPSGGSVGGAEGALGSGYVEPFHAAAPGGDQVYFTEPNAGQLYLRLGLTGSVPKSVWVSAPNEGVTDPYVEEVFFGEPLPAVFQEATEDGARAFFLSSQKLTADASTGPEDEGQDLYVFNRSSGELEDVTGGLEDSNNENGARVVALLGASADGRSGYFVARGTLDNGAHSGAPNIYRFVEGPLGHFSLTFVATLSDQNPDQLNWSMANVEGLPGSGSSSSRASRVSADGADLVFSSIAALTPYNNHGCGSTFNPIEACTEIYLYSAATERTICISCNPTGIKPLGEASLSANYLHVGGLVTTFSPTGQLTRNVSNDGSKIFFQTPDSLVTRDKNGFSCRYVKRAGFLDLPSCTDVYEWESPGAPGGSCQQPEVNGGCLYLLSSGESEEISVFVDASSDGSNAFIATSASLVPTDRDELTDLYDVRVNGGLESQFAVPGLPCEDDGCRGSTDAPGNAASPGSSSFAGPGNPKPKPTTCKKKSNKKNCKKKHHHGDKRHKNQKGHKKQGRAGSSRGGQK